MDTTTNTATQNLIETIATKLNALENQGRYRQLKTFDAIDGVLLTLNGKQLTDFSGNDYLGFSQHPAIVEASIKATEKWGASTTSSRLIRGTFSYHQELEEKLCAFLNAPKTLVFNSGFQANAGILPTLIQRGDFVFSDRLNHASLIDGLLLSNAKVKRYSHLDLTALENGLSEAPEKAVKWIISETVFSMDGDIADIKKLLTLSEKYNAWLFLDEAHAVGLFGNNRHSGLLENLNLQTWPEQLIVMGTFSKALGSFGSYVAAHPLVIKLLINQCRSFIYSTSLPASIISANSTAIDILCKEHTHTQMLWNNINYFSTALGKTAQSAITPIIIGPDNQTMQITDQLFKHGYYVQGIRPPTVPENTSRLRITLSASHTPEIIETFCRTLTNLIAG